MPFSGIPRNGAPVDIGKISETVCVILDSSKKILVFIFTNKKFELKFVRHSVNQFYAGDFGFKIPLSVHQEG